MFYKTLTALVLLFTCLPVLANEREPDFSVSSFAIRSAIQSVYDSPPPPILLAKKWEELSPTEKRRVKDAQDKYRKLPNKKQKKLRDEWDKMPKRERDKYKLEKDYR